MRNEPNLSAVDRAIRLVSGVALIVGGVFFVGGAVGIALAIAGAVLTFSGSIGFCHVYKVCGFSTRKKA